MAERGETIRILTAAERGAGDRIDRYLARRLADRGTSRSEVRRWIEAGRVTLDGALVREPDAKVPSTAGRTIEVAVPPPRTRELRPVRAAALKVEVLHDDPHVLVLAKPAGLVVHPTPGRLEGTLVSALLYRGGSHSGLGGPERPGLVHRLDRDTSGVIVVARTDEAHRALAAQWKAYEVEKEYLAIVEGEPRLDRGEIDLGLARSRRDRTRVVAVGPGGARGRRGAPHPDPRPRGEGERTGRGVRAALTRYEVLERYGGLALVRCLPETGRTHQIRVHLARGRGTPILCDAVYGRRASATREELLSGLTRPAAPGSPPVLARQALHARRLAFRHPGDPGGRRIELEAPLPKDMEAALEALRTRRGRALR